MYLFFLNGKVHIFPLFDRLRPNFKRSLNFVKPTELNFRHFPFLCRLIFCNVFHMNELELYKTNFSFANFISV